MVHGTTDNKRIGILPKTSIVMFWYDNKQEQNGHGCGLYKLILDRTIKLQSQRERALTFFFVINNY